MRLKKLITGMILIVLFMSQISMIPFNNFVLAAEEAENPNSTKFHYQQLDELGKKVYNGIYEMYMQGVLKTGIDTFDLAKDDKYVTQEQLEDYMKGNTELKSAMNAARYAFYADYPEVFYINFQNLTVRVTKDSENRYHANIGSGNRKSYYVDGFTSKEQVEEEIVAFNERVNEIAESAKNLEIEEGKNLIVEQAKFIHNEIINSTSYRLESDCTEGNQTFIGTPYGALVKQQAVCEGYARALKVVLDKAGITCILVQGTHQSEGAAAVPHMWNYIQIDEEVNTKLRTTRETKKVWYAIDATLDDPFLRKITGDNTEFEPGEDIQEGFENTRYCIVGTETMNKEHVVIESVEAAGNYTFQYPELNPEDYGVNTAIEKDGLSVRYKQDGTQTEEYKSGDFYISYNGKGYAKASEEGKYMIMKSYYYKPADDEWEISPWAYFLPDVYAGGFRDYDDHIYLTMPNSEYVEFAVTTKEPGDYVNDPKELAYQGDESDFIARTEKLYNPSGTYKGRPYIKTQTPPATTTLEVGTTYHVDVTYTDNLELAEGATQIGYRMESTGITGAEKSEITNFAFDGKNRVTFDIKFSQMFADDDAIYRIYLTGVVGRNSNKEPNAIIFGATNTIACSYSMNKAKNWEVFAKPILLENEDLSMKDWKTSDGKSVSDQLKSRIALVATRTTNAEKDAMTDLMENELPNQELVTSETYNISLNVCKKYVVKTGHRLRLSLGFPAGYGPEDAGVTFKAYHFIRNSDGEVTGVEEIPCVITPYGLIVTCNSFSPFAIAVVENDGTQTSQEKSVVVSAEEGGVINGANREEGNIITLAEGESKTINVQANEGYQIETLTVCGQVIDMTQEENKKSKELTISYDDVKDGNCIVNATFVAEEVLANEEARGEVAVQPTATPATVQIPNEKTVSINSQLEISANVGETEGLLTFQWYKDNVKLEGKTNRTLTIDSATEEDAGTYTLKVTTTLGTVSEETTSNECVVTVRGFGISIVSADETVDLEKLEPGSEFEVNVDISNMTNIGNGIISLMGQLEYDTNLLDRVSVVGVNSWNLENNSFNESNFKFITDNNNHISQTGTMFKIKFKVKDTITEATESIIKIKGITASGGDGVIGAEDAQIGITIQMPEPVEEKITSEVYVVNNEDKDISRIAPETTVAKFKENVETEQEMKFLDKDGNVLTEDSIIATGMTIKVGKTLEYTLVVTGDTDGDGSIEVNDLARVKLHLIDYKKLTGIELKAANIDNDDDITVNDAAQIKLVLIGLMEVK